MIGRADPLERLAGLLDAAEIGSGDLPFVALVSGEAGIGKSRLLQELVDTAPGDVTVQTVQAQPGSIGRAYHAVAQLAPDGDPATAAFTAVAAAAEEGRTLLVVEDLHWADAASVGVLDTITQAPLPHLVVVGTYRPGDLTRGSPGGELVLRLERRHAVEQVRLDRLDRTEVGLLLGAITGQPASSAAVEAVHRRSAGVPFVVEELVRAAPADCQDDLASGRLPWSLDDAVRQQVAGLEPDERRVVDAVGVYGRPISFDALRAMTGLDDRGLLAALRGLTDRGVVTEPHEDQFWFNHALVADVVVGQLLGRERRSLHERAANVLRDQAEPDLAALAEHLHGAGHYDDAVDVARAGARSYLNRGASFQALRLAGPALAEQPDDVELLSVATEAAWRLDFSEEAIEYARRWLAASPGGTDRVDALRMVGRLSFELERTDERDAVIARMEAMAAELPPGAERARARGALAQLHMLGGDAGDAVAWADLAIAEAEALGDDYVATQASVERGSALDGIDGEIGEATAELRQAAARARALGDGVLEARAINNLMEFVPLQSAESRELLETLFRLTDRIGFDKLERDASHWRMHAMEAAGDLAAFRRSLEEVLPHWTRRRHPMSQLHSADVSSYLALEEGRLDDARRLLEVDGPISSVRGARANRLRNVIQLGGVAGDGHLAEAALDALTSAAPVRGDTFALNHLVRTVDAALVAGVDPIAVAASIDRLCIPSVAPTAHRHLDGMVAEAGGRHEPASDALAGVLADPDETLSVPARATLRLWRAQAVMHLGDRVAASAEAHRAREELTRWPGWRRDRVDALLRRLEGARRGDGVLTTREREVATLIADGLTNGQLADKLFISPKTAAVHVSNILAKLGLSGRAEVAAWAVRTGLVASDPPIRASS